MDYLGLLKASGQKALANAYILINKEDYLYTHTIDRIKADYVDEGLSTFNYMRLDGRTASYDEIVTALVTLPMMADTKVNIIENLDQVAMSEKQLDDLVALAVRSEGTVNCFTFEMKKSKAYNRLKKEKVEIIEFGKLPDVQFKKWVIKRFREAGKKIDEQALRFFIEYSMYTDRSQQISLYHMENEIKKIASLDQEVITAEALRNVMIMPLEMNVFSLTDHLAAGELRESFEKLDELMAKGHGEYELMPLLTKTYHNMLLAKAMNKRGASNDAIKSVLGFKSDYPVKMLLKRTSGLDCNRLMCALEHCLDFESQLKSRTLDKRIHLENLMVKLTQ